MKKEQTPVHTVSAACRSSGMTNGLDYFEGVPILIG
jgi:hypothetical protein